MASSTNNNMMKGVVAIEGKCVSCERSLPEPSADEVLVKVRACGINRLDVIQRMGKAKPPPGAPDILGLELAGEVISLGSNVSSFEVGDRVMCLVSGGAYAEYVVAPVCTTMKIPANVGWEVAGGVPEAGLTAFQLVHFMGKVAEGDSVLIHAGASGVGTIAIQLATVLGAKVYVTVGSQDKLDVCKSLGAVGGAVRHEGPWIDVLSKEFDSIGGGFDVILDCVGGSYAEQNLTALKLDGRWVLYSMLGGPTMSEGAVSKFLPTLLGKRITLLATTLRGRSASYKTELVQAFSEKALPLLENGSLKILIHQVFNRGLDDVESAHELMESNGSIGKLILTLS